ncbi:enoyl-CoA hydratase [Gordonia caeni]|uniref:Enoyl-CoA hydratase n=1 Tax=Gordonia caeni TaxID=1007097 RepID=A0ABP7NX24_9ACTN
MSDAVIPPPLGPDDLTADSSPVAYQTGGPDGAVAYVTLNRPEFRNAQNSVMTYSLDAAFRKATDDPGVKVIVLRAEGKHFSAGHDIGTPERDPHVPYPNVAALHWDHTDGSGDASGKSMSADQRLAREIEVYVGMCRRWRDMPKPLIAQVHGACIAGGLMLAWAADFIVASDDAFFSDPVARMGIPGVEYFAHAYVLGPRRAKEILMTGERFTAQQALDWGMVNHVVPRDELAAKVDDICAKMAEMPMQGLFLSKKAVNICEDQMGMRNAMDSVFGWHHYAHSANAETGDSLAGMDAKSMKSAGERR